MSKGRKFPTCEEWATFARKALRLAIEELEFDAAHGRTEDGQRREVSAALKLCKEAERGSE